MKNSLTLRRMLAFSLGDFFGGGAFNIINFLYPGFLALAVGLPAHLAGVVMTVSRIFDAVIDPAIGYFSDKLRVRYGTRRGSLLVSAPLIVLSLFLMFYPYSNPSLAVRFWSVLLSYILFCLVHSATMIPYNSLSSEMTEDYTERARMTSIRLGFSIFASLVCVALPGIIVDAFEGNRGFIAMSLIFGIVFMICVCVTGLFAKEGVPAPKKADRVAVRDFFTTFKVKSFRQYLWMFLTCQITMAIMSALFFFYIDFYFARDMTAQGVSHMVGYIGAAIMFGIQIVALPFYLWLIKKTSKATAFAVGSVIWIVGGLLLFVLPSGSSAVVLYLLAAFIGFGISGPGLIPHAMFGDVVDVGDLQFGVRNAGAFAGAANLVIQLGQALSVGLVMVAIGVAGFVEQDISYGAELVVSQAVSAQTAIVTIMALAPLVFMSIGIFFSAKYKLSKENHAKVLAALESGKEDKDAVLDLL